MSQAKENGRAHAPPLVYAIVTPARNEEAFIGRTLESVIAQTVRPVRWVIVSDGSTDSTDRIVGAAARLHPWIEILRVERPGARDFARKAHAFNAGVERLRGIDFDVLANLDADVSLDPDHFAFLLDRFAEMPDLGVAGTAFIDEAVRYDYAFTSIEHVSGGCQLFRRACLAELGGYLPIDCGGVDWVAVTTARMNGWKTRTFAEKTYVHHRTKGSADAGPWRRWFRYGRKDYAMGGHPVWELARAAYQATSPPYLLRGLALFAGYAHASLARAERPVSRDFVRFHRAEQMARLRSAATVVLRDEGANGAGAGGGDPPLGAVIADLERWVEARDYKGYEPFDGLSSFVRPLAFGSGFLERVLQQVGRQSPVNLRPLLGVKPLESTKGRGCMAAGYLAMRRSTGEEHYAGKAVACLEWLVRNKSPLYPDFSWGNHFDYVSRAGRYAKQESIIVWTSLIGQAFLDAFEILGEERYLDVAKSACAWILELPRERTSRGTCLSYLAARQLSIHNANLLGAAMLARTARHTRSGELLDVARAAVEYSCSRQRPDGSWYYGEEPIYRWIDSFHTGYDLDALDAYIQSSGDEELRPALEAGYRFFRTSFVEPDGRPKYYHDRTYPIDIQCAAQAIETCARFADRDPSALRAARSVARWTIRHMRDPSGYFYYRRYPLVVARIPMLHWGQATMYRALARLAAPLTEAESNVPIEAGRGDDSPSARVG